MNLKITLCTLEREMAVAWESAFGSETCVAILVGDILKQSAGAILSPANSFGFMDGGIDLAYSHFFGWEVEGRLKTHLRTNFGGELLVGQAVIIPTENKQIPYLVSAPTMRVPTDISATVNVYLAFRAALLAIHEYNRQHDVEINSLLSPALGAGIGCMPVARVAKQMYAAFREVVYGEVDWRNTARGVLAHHANLLH